MDKHRTARRIRELNDPMVLPMEQISLDSQPLLEERYGNRRRLGGEPRAGYWGRSTHKTSVRRVFATGVIRCAPKKFLDTWPASRRSASGAKGTFPARRDCRNALAKQKNSLSDRAVHPHGQDPRPRHSARPPSRQRMGNEMTIRIRKKGVYQALHPSITVAESDVLSLEEIQGGTKSTSAPAPRRPRF